MGHVFSGGRLRRVCGGLADVLKESSQACRGDEQVNGWIVRDVAVGVWRPGRDVDVVAGAGVVPLEAVATLGEDLLGAGQDVEGLGVVVAVDGNHHPGWDDAPHDAQPVVRLVRGGQELDGRAEHVQYGTVGSLGNVVMNVAWVVGCGHAAASLSCDVLTGLCWPSKFHAPAGCPR